MSEDSIFKLVCAAIGSYLSYLFTCIIKNNNKHETHNTRISEHDKEIAVLKEQNKHVLEKLEDVVTLSTELKESNKIILRTLARKSKGK